MPAHPAIADLTDRVSALEKSVSGIASSVKALVDNSKTHREQMERDQRDIWVAIKEQNTTMQTAMDKLSHKGDLSWGKIASVGGFFFLLASGLGAMAWQLSEGRVHQLEIHDEEQAKQLEQRLQFQKEMREMAESHHKEVRALEAEVRETHDKFLLRICDENHEGLRRHNEIHH